VLNDNILANLRTESRRSAVSRKFSRVFKSTLKANDCPRYANNSIKATNSELSIQSLKSSGKLILI